MYKWHFAKLLTGLVDKITWYGCTEGNFKEKEEISENHGPGSGRLVQTRKTSLIIFQEEKIVLGLIPTYFDYSYELGRALKKKLVFSKIYLKLSQNSNSSLLKF